MPKQSEPSSNGINISWSQWRGIGAFLGVLFIVWAAVENIVLEGDLAPIENRVASLELRVREVERTQDRFFGARPSPTGFSLLSLVRSSEEAQRRVVVPQDFVEKYKLSPSRGGAYTLLGEDGNYYALDDVIWVLIREHLRGK